MNVIRRNMHTFLISSMIATKTQIHTVVYMHTRDSFRAHSTVWIAVVEFLGGKVMFLNPANGRKEYVTAKVHSQ